MTLDAKLAGILATLKEADDWDGDTDAYVKSLEQEIQERQDKIDRLRSLTRAEPTATGEPSRKRRRRSDAGKRRANKGTQGQEGGTPAGTGAEPVAGG